MSNSDIRWSYVAERLRGLESLVPAGSEDARALQQAWRMCDLRGRMRADDVPTPVIACPRVCVESPLRGRTEAEYTRNTYYADAALLDSLSRDEAPFLGHLLYPRVLDDTGEDDRRRGIRAHVAWLRGSESVAVYIDLGVSSGMQEALTLASQLKLPIVERSIPHWYEWSNTRTRRTPGFTKGRLGT